VRTPNVSTGQLQGGSRLLRLATIEGSVVCGFEGVAYRISGVFHRISGFLNSDSCFFQSAAGDRLHLHGCDLERVEVVLSAQD
jgi:hypothetical protein